MGRRHGPQDFRNTRVDPNETSKPTRDPQPHAERTQERKREHTARQLMRVCSPGLPALAGVLLVAPSSTVRPEDAHMRPGCILDSNDLTQGNVRETAVGTTAPVAATGCSRGTARPGNRAPELARNAPRYIPSRGSLPEALVVLGDIRRWLPWSYEKDTQEAPLVLDATRRFW